MNSQDVTDKFIEIESVDSDTFLKVKETLTRIGIASRKTGEKPTLWQSCHILHKRGHYYIVHFKQMFLLDGKFDKTDLSQDDLDRVTAIVNLLQQWNLVKTKKPSTSVQMSSVNLTVISFADKGKWALKSKYSIGRK
jgi:hypothetical protein